MRQLGHCRVKTAQRSAGSAKNRAFPARLRHLIIPNCSCKSELISRVLKEPCRKLAVTRLESFGVW